MANVSFTDLRPNAEMADEQWKLTLTLNKGQVTAAMRQTATPPEPLPSISAASDKTN